MCVGGKPVLISVVKHWGKYAPRPSLKAEKCRLGLVKHKYSIFVVNYPITGSTHQSITKPTWKCSSPSSRDSYVTVFCSAVRIHNMAGAWWIMMTSRATDRNIVAMISINWGHFDELILPLIHMVEHSCSYYSPGNESSTYDVHKKPFRLFGPPHPSISKIYVPVKNGS